MKKFTVEVDGHEPFEVEEGKVLRDALKDRGINIHNGPAKLFNCMGMGTCGTCAFEVQEGDLTEPSFRESIRLSVPPHSKKNNLRLSCQIRVHSNLKIKKHPGIWGTKKV